jgi:beta-lactamase class A
MNKTPRFLLLAALFVGVPPVFAASPLETQIASISSRIDSVVGVSALHVESGRRVAIRGDERFPMGSVYKLPIGVTAMRDIDRGRMLIDRKVMITPDQFSVGVSWIRDEAKGKPVTMTIGRLVRAMVGDSDNTACDYLLERVRGGTAVTAHMRELGVTDLDVNRSERQIDNDIRKRGGREKYFKDVRDSASPNALLDLLLKMHQKKDGLSADSRKYLLDAMTLTATGPNRMKAALPAGATLAHKTGTMPGTVNDAGIITSPDGRHHIVLVVLTKSGRKSTLEQREAVIAEITRAVYAAFTAPAAGSTKRRR